MSACLFWSDAIVLAACRHSAAHAGPQREALSTAVLGRRGQSWRAPADRAQGISLHFPIHIRVHHLCDIGFSGPDASALEVVSPGTRLGTVDPGGAGDLIRSEERCVGEVWVRVWWFWLL